MITKVKKYLLPVGLALFAALAISLTPTQDAFAVDAAGAACEGVQLIDSSAKCDDTNAAQSGVSNIIETVINVLSVIVGAISVIMIIIGGFRYVVSGGDSNNTKGAKDTILYAVIGLVIVLFAQVIVVFVISNTQPSAEAEEEETTLVVPLKVNA